MRLFYSYSHRDEAFRDSLDSHLTALKRSGVLSDWHDRKILPGDDLDSRINEYLEGADIVLFLVSADFLASKYIWDVEVKRALERHRKGEARVIPLILRPVDLDGVPFENLLRLPKDGLPVTEWPNRDLAFADVARGIRRAALEMSRQESHGLEEESAGFEGQQRSLDTGVAREGLLKKNTSLTGSWKVPSDPHFEHLLSSCLHSHQNTDLDILGYSVHAIDNVMMPLLRRVLEAQRRVRILVLSPSSDGFVEKSALEAPTHKLDLQEFRLRTKVNVAEEHEHLTKLREQIMYQKGLASADLRIRAYNQFPCFRGVHVHSQGAVVGSYLFDFRKPGRELPHFLLLQSPEDHKTNNEIVEMFDGWFSYLWEFRSRPFSLECVIFDLYDTLVRVRRDARTRVHQNMADLIGIPSDHLENLWQTTTPASNRGELSSTKERFAHILRECGISDGNAITSELARMEEDLLRNEVETAAGLYETLESLKRRGFKLALMSNCSCSVLQVLSSLNLFGFFDVIHLSFQTGHLKPNAEAYSALLRSLRLSPDACVFVGDGNNNELTGAKQARMLTVKMGWQTAPRPEQNADRALASLADLEPWLLTFDSKPVPRRAVGMSTD